MADISPAAWTYDTAAHLLLRAGFGHNGIYKKSTAEARQVAALAKKTPAEAVDSLVSFQVSKAKGPGKLTVDSAYDEKLQAWWLDRMIKGAKPVREKAVLFLHTLFATSKTKVDQSLYMAVQNALFREFANGDFRELVKRITIDPAMLWWLDGATNTASAPNENYGRELQELFTLGVFDFKGQPNYAQNDVKQAARMLTGWRFDDNNGKLFSYFGNISNPNNLTFNRHDKGAKTIYGSVPGETPLQDPANQYIEPANTTDYNLAHDEHRRLVDAIFNHTDTEGRPTVARHIARQAWKFYAYDPEVAYGTPRADLTLIDDLADAFKNNGYSLKELYRAMFQREEFYADRTRNVKSPVEYVAGTLRMLRGKYSYDTRLQLAEGGTRFCSGMGDMGQIILEPPSVFSWKGGATWITSQTFLARFEFARGLTERDKASKKDPVNNNYTNELGFNIYSFLDTTETTRAAVVDRFLKLLGPLNIDNTTRDELILWLGATDPIDLTDDIYVKKYVRSLVNLVLTLPHYHVQ